LVRSIKQGRLEKMIFVGRESLRRAINAFISHCQVEYREEEARK